MNKAPSFQWYPADYLADMQVRMLSWASRGLYVDLLCYCWREGYIPADSSAIAQLSGCHDLAIIEPCLLLFSESGESGKLLHKRLEKEREKQNEHRKERAEAGKKGAESRWGNKKPTRKKKDSKANGSANGSAMILPLAKNGSSSSTSSSSAIVSTNVDTVTRKKFSKPTIDEIRVFCKSLGMEENVGDYLFHKWEGNGWINGKNPIVDWKATIRSWKAAGHLPPKQNGYTKPSQLSRDDRHQNELKEEIDLSLLPVWDAMKNK